MHYPQEIYTGRWSGGHIQGIAVDQKNGFVYCSFTTELIKLDFSGKLIGSVKGFTGHLGCLAFNREDGRVCGSLEYKNDSIGRAILNAMGMREIKTAFYVAIFDGEKIDRPGMNAETDGVMTTVWLKEVVEDFQAVWEENGKTVEHRYGCAGIDGLTFAPAFDGSGMRMLVAYGIYGDVNRTDNDDQVILSYRPQRLKPYETVLTRENIHESGPDTCDEKYFVRTGNTTWGVQNMEYDVDTGDIWLAVYVGKKEQYPNFPLYRIDGSRAPTVRPDGRTELHLKQAGILEKGIWGSRFPQGSTGMASLGDGLFYFAHHYTVDGQCEARIRLYARSEDPAEAFVAKKD